MNHTDLPSDIERREFLKLSAAAALLAVGGDSTAADIVASEMTIVDDFARDDSLYHGDDWESLNPGYWQIKDGSLRRRLSNYGDRARRTGFPFHYETHKKTTMPVDYDPSLPPGVIYRRDWNLTGNFAVLISATVRDVAGVPDEGDDADWKMFQPGDGQMGIAFGAKTQFDSYGFGNKAWKAVWRNNGQLSMQPPARRGKGAAAANGPKKVSRAAQKLAAGDCVTLLLRVSGKDPKSATVTVSLVSDKGQTVNSVSAERVPRNQIEGWFGIVGRGLLDFEVNSVLLSPEKNSPKTAPQNECLNCYAIGSTLKQKAGNWQVRFVGLFRNDGQTAEIRVADSPEPQGGWSNVAVAGAASIVNNKFRRNTASISVTLPKSPAETTLYYTVWKDGVDVTADSRVGTDSTGPGTGLVGDVPSSGKYVGRLPQLAAPYRLCGLSCHAINRGVADPSGKNRPTGKDGSFEVRDQPTYDAYKHLDDYDFQVMVWEDDVWYLELLIYPPSTDDAYKIINTSISGPTSRWQMMRHWNVLNPGDHDYGMDDVKGPEQIVLRMRDGLGQDRDYMRRNFQIVQHLISGEEEVNPTANPKKWRQWRMPNRDFSLLVLDSRLWRTSQDTKMWDDEGWGHINTLYDRADPTRALLGEEQFAWLQEVIRTDSSPLICLTGINGLHTVWTGGKKYSNTEGDFPQRDRVAADYAGWVAAGSDRVIDLLGSRDGVVSVYGDVHNGSILKNTKHRLYECSFGPIGRTGGRAVISDFGPEMKDYDGRDVSVKALYHMAYETPDLQPRTGPMYWNFLEMEFDPRKLDPEFDLRIRNLIDEPSEKPRGGGSVTDTASETGRQPSCRLPNLKLLPNADVRIALANGHPLRGTRTNAVGMPIQTTLVGVAPDTLVLVAAHDGNDADAKLVRTTPV
jgi:hypothetical protein